MFRTVSSFVALAALTACSMPFDKDILPISQRYAHVYEGQCNSWLRSSVTGFEYCSSPKLELDLTDYQPLAEIEGTADAGAAKSDGAAAVADGPNGEKIYKTTCAVCHGGDGKGMAGVFPPLAGSGDFYGDPQNMAKIIVGGLTGEITVQGVTYNGAMPPQAQMDDAQVAAVATYVRTNFGNADGPVTAADVAAIR